MQMEELENKIIAILAEELECAKSILKFDSEMHSAEMGGNYINTENKRLSRQLMIEIMLSFHKQLRKCLADKPADYETGKWNKMNQLGLQFIQLMKSMIDKMDKKIVDNKIQGIKNSLETIANIKIE